VVTEPNEYNTNIQNERTSLVKKLGLKEQYATDKL